MYVCMYTCGYIHIYIYTYIYVCHIHVHMFSTNRGHTYTYVYRIYFGHSDRVSSTVGFASANLCGDYHCHTCYRPSYITLFESMASPLGSFRAAERYVVGSSRMKPSSAPAVAESQAHVLVQTLGGLNIERDPATELLEALESDASPFTQAQRQMIAATVQSIVGGDTRSAEASVRQVAREQHNRFIFKYFPQKLWTVAHSDDDLNNKMRMWVHFLINNLGCRNPDTVTKRLVLSALHMASGIDPSPEAAYDDIHRMSNIFRQKRDAIPGQQTLAVFPEEPATFMQRFPEAYPASDPPIDCPLDVLTLIDRARKEAMPARNTNIKVRMCRKTTVPPPVHPQVQVGGMSIGADVIERALRNYMVGNQSMLDAPDHMGNMLRNLQVFAPQPQRQPGRPAQPYTDQTDAIIPRAQQCMAGQTDPLPGCLAGLHRGDLAGDLQGLQAKIQADLQGRRTTDCAAGGRTDDLLADDDGDDDDRAEPRRRSTGKRSSSTRSSRPRKRPAASPSSAASPTPSSPPKTSSPEVKKRPSAASPTPTPSPKTSGGSGKSDFKTTRAVVMSGESVFKYPFAVDELAKLKPKSDRPTPNRGPHAHHGGKIYSATASGKDILRVYLRRGDTKWQRVPIDWKKPAEVKRSWSIACACIETDTRPVC
jgi:hypothetical protein